MPHAPHFASRYHSRVTLPRADWTGGVAATPEAMDEIDQDWWLSLTPAERIAVVVELSTAYDWSDLDEDDGLPRRLLGPDCGVRG